MSEHPQGLAFGDWLTTHTTRNDRLGDLARDWAADPDRPDHATPADVRGRLDELDAIPAAVDTLDLAIAEWNHQQTRNGNSR